MAFLGAVGALALLAGGALTVHTYQNYNQSMSNSTGFGPTMWRNEPIDKLFPEALGFKPNARSDSTDPKRAQWHRLGISEKTGCDEGLNSALVTEVKKLGCRGVLRATYVDPTGNTLATVALIAFPKDTKSEPMHGFFSDREGKASSEDLVQAYPVPGTLAANWSDAQRNGSAGDSSNTLYIPYAFAASAGAVDGRKAGHLPGQWGKYDGNQDRRPWTGAAQSLIRTLETHLGELLFEETKK
ncbi:hypothetical protein MOV08_13005 [Streptomyces yunnanensis]|uniref:Uncharacterized protein n=1 Tax=Streptomyces yunnanensis TaxID=156453 RepID=A0ABY8A8Q8_9ACTN|nr:hypothetical protein [Streptomyces yunnanensis]WEB40106.1 hypothetical protein MOV08_13005 [Streptomyces yunnanensis]